MARADDSSFLDRTCNPHQGTDLEGPGTGFIDGSLSDDPSALDANYLNQPGSNFRIAELAGQLTGQLAGWSKRTGGEPV